jgi:hypothetical protein
MNKQWKWVLGIALAMLVLLVPTFAWRFFLSYGGYGMLANTNGWHMPLMYGTPGMMGFGMMFLMWLTLVASLVLIGLGIALFAKLLTAQKL